MIDQEVLEDANILADLYQTTREHALRCIHIMGLERATEALEKEFESRSHHPSQQASELAMKFGGKAYTAEKYITQFGVDGARQRMKYAAEMRAWSAGRGPKPLKPRSWVKK